MDSIARVSLMALDCLNSSKSEFLVGKGVLACLYSFQQVLFLVRQVPSKKATFDMSNLSKRIFAALSVI